MPTFFHCNSTHTILSKMNAKMSELQSSSLLSFLSFFVLVYLKHLVCLIMAFPHSIQHVSCLLKSSMFLASLKSACFLPLSSQQVSCFFKDSMFLASFMSASFLLLSRHVSCLFQVGMFLASFK